MVEDWQSLGRKIELEPEGVLDEPHAGDNELDDLFGSLRVYRRSVLVEPGRVDVPFAVARTITLLAIALVINRTIALPAIACALVVFGGAIAIAVCAVAGDVTAMTRVVLAAIGASIGATCVSVGIFGQALGSRIHDVSSGGLIDHGEPYTAFAGQHALTPLQPRDLGAELNERLEVSRLTA